MNTRQTATVVRLGAVKEFLFLIKDESVDRSLILDHAINVIDEAIDIIIGGKDAGGLNELIKQNLGVVKVILK